MLNHNKSMLRVLLLVLSVLMVVSLAACGNDSSNDDMNAALSQAIADQQAALESQKKAQEDALAAQKAEQDAALAAAESERKAAEESLKAEAEQAKKDAEAAEQAAKKAEESAKAAAEAQKKAEESMKKAEESRKKAESESAKKAEESRKAYESSVAASISAALATSAPETTEAPVSNTEAIKAVIAEFSKMRAEYNANLDMYVGTNADEIHMYFEKASIELTFATTLEAAQDVLNQLKVDVEAVESVATVAAELNTLIDALGDVEVDVITTSAAKLNAVTDAWYDMAIKYGEYLTGDEYDEDEDLKDETGAYWADFIAEAETTAAKKLKVNMVDYNKALNKMATLKSYIKGALTADLAKIYIEDYDEYEGKFDDRDYKTNKNGIATLIAEAYYKYQILSVVNGGDTTGADLPIDWEYKLKDGEKIEIEKPAEKAHPLGNGKTYDDFRVDYEYDTTKPIAYFTTEDFIDIYAIVYLDAELVKTIDAAVAWLNEELLVDVDPDTSVVTTNVLYSELNPNISILLGQDSDKANVYANIALGRQADVERHYEDVVEAFEDAAKAVSFEDAYKATKTLSGAQKDIWNKALTAYVDAVAYVVELSKEDAKKEFEDKTADVVKAFEVAIKNADEESSSYATKVANLNAKIDTANANIDAFNANVDAAPVYTVADLNSDAIRLNKKGDAEYKKLGDYVSATGINSAILAHIKREVKAAMTENFVIELATAATGELGLVVGEMVDELVALREKFCEEDGVEYEKLLGKKVLSLNEDDEIYVNSDRIAVLAATIDTAIADLQALSVDAYADKEEVIKWTKTKVQNTDTYKEKALYFKNEETKQKAIDEGKDEEWFLDNVDYVAVYFTTTANDLPFTYTYTADEQAAVAAQGIYTAALKDIFSQVLTLMANADTDDVKVMSVSDAKKIITNSDAKTAYDTVLSNVGGNATLKSEVQTLANKYLDSISNVAYFRAMGKSEDAKVVKLATVSNTITKAETGHVTINESVAHADEFSTANIEAYIKGQADTFMDNAKYNLVVDLYKYRQDIIADIKADIAEYKNEYTLVTDKDDDYYGWYLFVPNTTDYAYDEADATVYVKDPETGKDTTTVEAMYVKTIDADAQAWEAKLDELANNAVNNINKVVFNKGKTTVAYGKGGNEVTDYEVKEDLAKAKTLVDAYNKTLFGTKSGHTNGDNKTYSGINSLIFAQYNTLVLKNYQGYTVD